MAHEGLNTIDPTVAERWVNEYEKKREANKSAAARARQALGKIIELAEGAGLNRKAFTDELKEREWRRKIDSLTAGDSEEEVEQKELLKTALGGLPLGDWGVEQMAPTPRRKKKKKDTDAVSDPGEDLTPAEAKEILARPKGKGRPTKQRITAQKIVDAGASGAQAEAIAEAMGPDDRGDNVEDLRPSFLRERDTTPPEAA